MKRFRGSPAHLLNAWTLTLTLLGCEGNGTPPAKPGELVATSESEIQASPTEGSANASDNGAGVSDRRKSNDMRADIAPLDFVASTLGGKSDEELPWIIALHGLGDTPEAFSQVLQAAPLKAHVFALRAPHPYHRGHDWFGVRLTGDQRELASAIERAADQVAHFIDYADALPATSGKPVVFGFSQGGMLSFALAARHADKLSFVVPIGGTLPETLWPRAAPSSAVPIVALHGASDKVIPIAPTRSLVDTMKRSGFDVRLEEFDGVGHRIPSPVRRALFDLLVAAVQDSSRR